MAAPVHTIDRLPEVERKKVLDSILAGETLSSIAARLGITRQAMSSYKNRVVVPAMKTAAEITDVRRRNRQDNSEDNVSRETYQPPKQHAIDIISENKALTREIVKASPLMERHGFLWEKTQQGIKDAASAVRVTYDEQGNEVSMAQDLSALAPLLNQGHKSIELLGRLTGELRDNTGPTLVLNIVSAAEENKRIDYSDPEEIELD